MEVELTSLSINFRTENKPKMRRYRLDLENMHK